MRACYLASDPRIKISAPTGYSSHIRKTIAAFREHGVEVLQLIAGDLRDISTARSVFRRSERRSSRFVRLLRSLARDIFEIVDDNASIRVYRTLLLNNRCDFIYERMAPFRTVGTRLATEFNIPLILEVNDPMSEVLSLYTVPLKKVAVTRERKLLRSSTGVIVGSQRLKQHFVAQGVPDKHLVVVYPTVDSRTFASAGVANVHSEAERSRHTIRVGFVGNMQPWHKVDLLLRAFARIGAGTEMELQVIGDGPELDTARQLSRDLCSHRNVSFLGSVEHGLIPGLLSNIDICVIPHATWYGSPTKLFEYGALARCVVGPRGTPVDEIIDNNVTGVLTALGSESELTREMEALAKDANRRRRLGTALQQKLKEEINWSRNMEAILRMIDRGSRKED
jgi:glycosyltransferase involved in cell wall biosynthesis